MNGQTVGQKVKFLQKLVHPLEVTVLFQSSWKFTRMYVLNISVKFEYESYRIKTYVTR